MKRTLLFLLLIFVAFGCKKENRIEKNLWKNGGEWNIVTWDERATSTYFPEDNYAEIMHNPGYFKFKEDGTGSIVFTEGSSPYIEGFKYQNTENTLTIFDEDGEGTIFDLDWKKNKMTLSFNEADTYTTGDGDGGQVTVSFTRKVMISCEKK